MTKALMKVLCLPACLLAVASSCNDANSIPNEVGTMKGLYREEVNDSQLKALEEEFHEPLPTSYRHFLKAHNGLDVEPARPCKPKYDPKIDVDLLVETFYGIRGEEDDDRYNLSAVQYGYDFNSRVSENVICIAEASYRMRICLSLAGNDKGKIYLWVPTEDWPEDDVQPSYDELRLIFDSFDELLTSLDI